MYFSTRDERVNLSASQALIKGLSDEGGLFLPREIPALPVISLQGKSYAEVAFEVLRLYLDDFSDSEILSAVNKAYSPANFPSKILDVASFGSFSFLELFHGPTLTFKDMALSLLPELLSLALAKHPEVKELHILTATSGDTGSAVLSSFSRSGKIDVAVLYPDQGISPIQEKQMLSFTSPYGRAYALNKANFDDCQSLVKKLLRHPEGHFSSANSINIGRLLPQIVYYYVAYLQLASRGEIAWGETINAVVPTGNFGDIFAAYLAKRMGLPLARLVVASNANRVLSDFFQSGCYDCRRPFLKTNSPSMDILISSNLERLLYLVEKNSSKVVAMEENLRKSGFFQLEEAALAELQKDFLAYSANEQETLEALGSCYRENHYLLDPHTSVAYSCYKKAISANAITGKSLLVATASPLKFPQTVLLAFGQKETSEIAALDRVLELNQEALPASLKKALQTPAEKIVLSETEFAHRVLKKFSYEVVTPATSANLGPGFDVCGIALALYNRFLFSKAPCDQLVGFLGKEETEDNLVLKSYRRFFEKTGLAYQPVKITQRQQGIPLARGLGSSASCIVAGLLGANAMAHHYLSRSLLLDLAVEIEGHPDNVAPCLFGGLIASYKKEDGSYSPMIFSLHRQLGFLLCIPEQELQTSLARGVLPKTYPLGDITYDSSRLIQLPSAFKTGDLLQLKELLSDRLHVPYRLPLIPEADTLLKIAEKHRLPFTISGAGSSLLILYRKERKAELASLLSDLRSEVSPTWEFRCLSPDFAGAEVFTHGR